MRVRIGAAISAMFVLLAGLIPIRAALPDVPFMMTAFAVNMTNVNVPRGNAGVMQLRITGWSPDGTRQRLIQTMMDKGQDALLREMQREPSRGRMSFPNWQGSDPQNFRLGWDLRYTAHEPLPEGGDRIVIATDRVMSFWEVRNRPRTFDYPFTLIEIHIPKEGKGEGRAFGATQITFDRRRNQMVLEQYSAGEIRLNEITVQATNR